MSRGAPGRADRPAPPGEPGEPGVPGAAGEPGVPGADEQFELSGPLPGPGMTVIEASAGTGKTFTLAGLVVRYLAEGTAPEEILAVTFTRMATGELRDRVRQRLVATELALGRYLDHGVEAPDEVSALLCGGERATVEAHRSRLGDALSAFDGLTITTTHGFCHLVLSGLGSVGDLDASTTLLEDQGELLEQVVADLYLRWAGQHGAAPPFGYAVALSAAAAAVANPDARLVPPPDGEHLLSRLASAARVRLAERLAAADLLTYDQVLTRLAANLADPLRGPAACERLRRRYRVVLVDELQDTDPTQWEVLQRAFGTEETVLVLIGDPKQAIYAFRGADVHAYLAAHRRARRFTLAANWRADQPLLDATEALLSPLQLGHPAIRFRQVRAPSHRRAGGLSGGPSDLPVRIRLVPAHHPDLPLTGSKGLLQKPAVTRWVAADVAGQLAGLLASAATVSGARGPRPLGPGDLAVLTRTNAQAEIVRSALGQVGVPAVLAGDSSIFAARAAQDWLHLLDALQEPASRRAAVAAAGTPFLGWSAAEIASAAESRWGELHDRLQGWSGVLAERGVAALARAVSAGEGLPARLLGFEGGERELTDLLHVAELLHGEALAGQLGAASLRAWLAARVEEAGRPGGPSSQERSRRLDSDAEAVQVLTVHRAKGLEFGVVACPYLWDAGWGIGSEPVWFHDSDADSDGDGEGDERLDGAPRWLDVADPSPAAKAGRRRSVERAKQEAEGEDLRGLYVALTRARHQVLIWWARAFRANRSPLGRLLTARDPAGRVGPGDPKEPDARRVRRALGPIVERAGGLLSVEDAGAPAPGDPKGAGPPPAGDAGVGEAFPPELAAASFERAVDPSWRRYSYTSIVAPAQGAPAQPDPVGSEAEDAGVGDEPAIGTAPLAAALAPDPGGSRPCPLGVAPRGALFGTLVHRVLESVDFAASDLAARLSSAAGRADPGGAVLGDPAELASGLALAVATPLGPCLPGVALADVGRADRLDELRFELPLVGGDRPAGELAVADIAALLALTLPAGDRLAAYPEHLGDRSLGGELRGYLTGSIDLVWRRPGTAGGTWWVADYKTNWLGGHGGDAGAAGAAGEALSTWDYRPAALDAEMLRHHYPLQALLYLVALHRYLRWRLPGYDPEANLGGVLYLFLRGMVGPDTPAPGGEPAGVWSWAPPAGLVPALSVLLGTGRATTAPRPRTRW